MKSHKQGKVTENNEKAIHLLSPDLNKNYRDRLYKIKSTPVVMGGTPITEELATEIREIAFGSASLPPRNEWVRSPLLMRPSGKSLAYGLMAPRNCTRSLLTSLQAHIIKWALFQSRHLTKDKKPENYLLLSDGQQDEALWRACSEVVWRCSARTNCQINVRKAVVALPTDNIYVQNSLKYYQDGVTEKLHLFEISNEDELQIFFKRNLQIFQHDEAPGALLLLYAVILTRGCENIKKDLDGKLNYLTSSQAEGSLNIIMLLLTGRATPYLHNGVVYVGDEDNYALPQYGVLSRSAVGLLLWYEGYEKRSTMECNLQPGSRLKTPGLPIWITSASGRYGVLFNTNRELLNNYQAEKRFDIHYYTVGGCHVLLNVDTRSLADAGNSSKQDEIYNTPIEKLIHTKWQDARITWPENNFKM